MKNRESVLKHMQEGEANQARVYEFGPYTMLPHGVFGGTGLFELEITEAGLRSLAEACKIPTAYLAALPDHLKAHNVNFGLSEHKVREKYDIIVSNFRLLGLIPKRSLFIPNSDIVTAVNSLADHIDDQIDYSLWETSDTATAFLITLGESRVRIGFLILYYRLIGAKPYAYTAILDETSGTPGKVIIVPGDCIIEPSNYIATLRSIFFTKVKDREKFLLDGYLAFRTTGILSVFPSLNEFFKYMGLGKRLEQKIYQEYSHRFNIHSIHDVINIIYQGNKNASIFRRINTGKTCGKLLLKVADYEHTRF